MDTKKMSLQQEQEQQQLLAQITALQNRGVGRRGDAFLRTASLHA
jgi:hypothetical protein